MNISGNTCETTGSKSYAFLRREVCSPHKDLDLQTFAGGGIVVQSMRPRFLQHVLVALLDLLLALDDSHRMLSGFSARLLSLPVSTTYIIREREHLAQLFCVRKQSDCVEWRQMLDRRVKLLLILRVDLLRTSLTLTQLVVDVVEEVLFRATAL